MSWVRSCARKDNTKLGGRNTAIKFTIDKISNTAKKESLIRKPLKELEDELDPEKFWKIHRGTIVNVSAISKVSKSMTGKFVIKLDGHEQPLLVSRSYTHLFRQM